MMRSASKQPLIADSDGYFNIVLSYYGVPMQPRTLPDGGSGSRMTFAPIEQKAIDQFNARGGALGEIASPRALLGSPHPLLIFQRLLNIDEEKAAFRVENVQSRMVECLSSPDKRVQQVNARVKPCGPYGHAFTKLLNNPHRFVSFGLRALAASGDDDTNVVVKILTWDVILDDPYPDLIVLDDHPNPSNKQYGIEHDPEFGDWHLMDPTDADLSLFNTKNFDEAV